MDGKKIVICAAPLLLLGPCFADWAGESLQGCIREAGETLARLVERARRGGERLESWRDWRRFRSERRWKHRKRRRKRTAEPAIAAPLDGNLRAFRLSLTGIAGNAWARTAETRTLAAGVVAESLGRSTRFTHHARFGLFWNGSARENPWEQDEPAPANPLLLPGGNFYAGWIFRNENAGMLYVGRRSGDEEILGGHGPLTGVHWEASGPGARLILTPWHRPSLAGSWLEPYLENGDSGRPLPWEEPGNDDVEERGWRLAAVVGRRPDLRLAFHHGVVLTPSVARPGDLDRLEYTGVGADWGETLRLNGSLEAARGHLESAAAVEEELDGIPVHGTNLVLGAALDFGRATFRARYCRPQTGAKSAGGTVRAWENAGYVTFGDHCLDTPLLGGLLRTAPAPVTGASPRNPSLLAEVPSHAEVRSLGFETTWEPGPGLSGRVTWFRPLEGSSPKLVETTLRAFLRNGTDSVGLLYSRLAERGGGLAGEALLLRISGSF